MTKPGNGLSAELDKHHVTIFKNGLFLKRVDLNDAVERRMLIVDLVKQMGAAPSKVASGLDISRQRVYKDFSDYRFGS